MSLLAEVASEVSMKLIQFKVNLPADVKAWLEDEAKRNVRSQGAQIVSCLRAAMAEQTSPVEPRQ